MYLATPRLIIRTPSQEDTEALLRLWCDPQVTEFSGGPRDKDEVLSSIREDLQKPPRDFQFWTVLEKSSGLLVADAGLAEKNVEGQNEIELNYFLVPEFWRRGYATEIAQSLLLHAFNTLKINRVIALIHPQNLVSKRVAEKAGMHFERASVSAKGNRRDLFVRTQPLCG